MALSRDKKQSVVSDLEELLTNSKLVVIAKYQGTPVKAMQGLRSAAQADGTTVRVAKNRLFERAVASTSSLSSLKLAELSGQLMYAFADDEVAPARAIADFAKAHPNVEFVSGITSDGQVLSIDDLKSLASLPTKDVLRAQLIGTISAPISGLLNVMSGNIRGVLNVLNARAEALGE